MRLQEWCWKRKYDRSTVKDGNENRIWKGTPEQCLIMVARILEWRVFVRFMCTVYDLWLYSVVTSRSPPGDDRALN